MKTLKITIDKLGKPKVEADGFNGVGCVSATKPVLAALTSKDSDVAVEEKSEMHMCSTESEMEMEGL